MSCSTFSSLASNTRSSAYVTVWMICPPILKSPNTSRASLVRHALYTLNRIGDKQHPCLTPLLVFTLLISRLFSRTLTRWVMYKWLSIFFRASQYQFPLGSAFIWSSWLGQMPSASLWSKHCSASISKVRSDTILSIPIALLFSSSKSKLIFSGYILKFPFNPSSKYPCYYLCCMCDKADCAMVAAFCSLWLIL